MLSSAHGRHNCWDGVWCYTAIWAISLSTTFPFPLHSLMHWSPQVIFSIKCITLGPKGSHNKIEKVLKKPFSTIRCILVFPSQYSNKITVVVKTQSPDSSPITDGGPYGTRKHVQNIALYFISAALAIINNRQNIKLTGRWLLRTYHHISQSEATWAYNMYKRFYDVPYIVTSDDTGRHMQSFHSEVSPSRLAFSEKKTRLSSFTACKISREQHRQRHRPS